MPVEKVTSKKKQLLIIIGIAVLVIGTTLAYLFISNMDTLASVGSKKITKRDLNEQIYGIDFQGSIDNPKQISLEEKKKILDRLVEQKIAELESKQLGVVSPNEEELETEIARRIGGNYTSYSEEQRKITKKNVSSDMIVEAIKNKIIGWREGKFILVRFDKAYEDTDDISNPSVIEAANVDKQYAQSLADNIYQDIKSDKITFEQGMAKADNDPRVGKPAWNITSGNYTFSNTFSKEQSIQKGVLAASKNFWSEVFNVGENQVSEPKLISIDDTSQNGSHEALFAIIKVEKSNKSNFSSYEEWLNKKKAEYKVKYYYKKLGN